MEADSSNDAVRSNQVGIYLQLMGTLCAFWAVVAIILLAITNIQTRNPVTTVDAREATINNPEGTQRATGSGLRPTKLNEGNKTTAETSV